MQNNTEIIDCGLPEVNKYCEDILSGEIPSCIFIEQAVQRFQEDLKKAEAKDYPYYFQPKAVEHFRTFVEENLEHFQGSFAGKPFILENWQLFLVSQIFGWLKKEKHNGEQNIRRFQTANVFIAKKNGKSILGAAIALYFLLYEGNGQEAYGFAMDRKHAQKLSWNTAKRMIDNNEELKQIFRVNNSPANYGISCDHTQSFFEPYSNKSDSADGLNPSLMLFDEIKDLTDPSIYETMQAGTVMRLSPLTLNITSCGYNTQSVGYELFQRSKKILSGEVDDEQTLAILYTIDEGDRQRFDDPDVWKKANPNYGVSVLEGYVEKRIDGAKDSNRVKKDVFTKNLNVFGQSNQGWLDIEQWDRCENQEISMADVAHLPAYITLDLSANMDLTNVKITFFDGSNLSHAKMYPFDFFYLPEARFERADTKSSEAYKDYLVDWAEAGDIIKCGSKSIDYEMVKTQIIELYESYDIKNISFDPWNSDYMVNELITQGIPEDLFIKYSQMGYKNWDNPMKQTEKLILERQITHSGNQVQRWCMENVTTKEKASSEAIRPDKPSKAQKIDGAITLIMAVGTFILTANEQDQQQKKLSPIAQRIMANKKDF